ncbi:hypothetical protein NDU88_007803 [Pleurodeles waltl]|uniref:Uncharacterized protein n=1 Tax=Pleurodeles waltl TaxID=8319 RepID=A0AAV7VRG6_PLEWA|nr:hypothetical protein NDU88_007803 [Pleurodeles waltl]
MQQRGLATACEPAFELVKRFGGTYSGTAGVTKRGSGVCRRQVSKKDLDSNSREAPEKAGCEMDIIKSIKPLRNEMDDKLENIELAMVFLHKEQRIQIY